MKILNVNCKNCKNIKSAHFARNDTYFEIVTCDFLIKVRNWQVNFLVHNLGKRQAFPDVEHIFCTFAFGSLGKKFCENAWHPPSSIEDDFVFTIFFCFNNAIFQLGWIFFWLEFQMSTLGIFRNQRSINEEEVDRDKTSLKIMTWNWLII